MNHPNQPFGAPNPTGLIRAIAQRRAALRRLLYPGLELGRGDHLPWYWWVHALWRVLRSADAEVNVERGQTRRVDPAAGTRTTTSSGAAEDRGAPARHLGRSELARGADVLRRGGSRGREPYDPRRSP
jgi:hypothetical protein